MFKNFLPKNDPQNDPGGYNERTRTVILVNVIMTAVAAVALVVAYFLAS